MFWVAVVFLAIQLAWIFGWQVARLLSAARARPGGRPGEADRPQGRARGGAAGGLAPPSGLLYVERVRTLPAAPDAAVANRPT